MRPFVTPRLAGAILLALAAVARPPIAAADSVFSIGGLGEPQLEEPARIRALGGAGVAEHGPRAFSLTNPASLGDVERILIEGTILPTWRRIEAKSEASETAHETTFPSLRAVIALPGRLVLGGAYLAGTSAEFRVDRPGIGGGGSSLRVDGTGGMTFARVSLARRISSLISVGLDYDVVAGSYREEWAYTFTDSSLSASRDTLEVSYEKRGRWRLGAEATVGRVTFGAVAEAERSLPLHVTQRADGSTVSPPAGNLKLPAGFILGASVPFGERFRGVGQYRRASYDRSTLETSTLVDFRAEERYSIGFERLHTAEGAPGPLGRLPLRIGAYLLRWPDLLPLAGASDITGGTAGVNEWALTLGTGLHSRDGGGAVDFSLEAGSRGNRDELGARERFVRFAISLQASDETWKAGFH
jgi:hypothetical protein